MASVSGDVDNPPGFLHFVPPHGWCMRRAAAPGPSAVCIPITQCFPEGRSLSQVMLLSTVEHETDAPAKDNNQWWRLLDATSTKAWRVLNKVRASEHVHANPTDGRVQANIARKTAY